MISVSARKQPVSLSSSCPTSSKLDANHLNHNGGFGGDPGRSLQSSGGAEPADNLGIPSGDLLSEGLITLAEAAKYCPRRRQGRKVHTTTLARWGRRGNRGVCLEVLDTPSGLCTSLPALSRFFGRLTEARDFPCERPERHVSDAEHEAVEAELARRFGI